MLVLNELEWAATDPRRSSTRCRNAVRHPAISRTEHQLGIMSEDTKLEDARNEVLRKIGRNVLNLQKMEGMLKLLNTHANISGNIDDLESVSRKQSESVSRHTMGRLVQAFVQSVYLHQTDLNIESESDSKPSISFSFTIEGDADLATEREKALLSIVEERNRLIHTDLTSNLMLLLRNWPLRKTADDSCQPVSDAGASCYQSRLSVEVADLS